MRMLDARYWIMDNEHLILASLNVALTKGGKRCWILDNA